MFIAIFKHRSCREVWNGGLCDFYWDHSSRVRSLGGVSLENYLEGIAITFDANAMTTATYWPRFITFQMSDPGHISVKERRMRSRRPYLQVPHPPLECLPFERVFFLLGCWVDGIDASASRILILIEVNSGIRNGTDGRDKNKCLMCTARNRGDKGGRRGKKRTPDTGRLPFNMLRQS